MVSLTKVTLLDTFFLYLGQGLDIDGTLFLTLEAKSTSGASKVVANVEPVKSSHRLLLSSLALVWGTFQYLEILALSQQHRQT